MLNSKTILTYSLSNENIVNFSTTIENFLQKLNISEKDKIRISLSLEEVFLNFQDKFGEEVEAVLIVGKKFCKPYIVVQIKGEEFNPLLRESDDTDDLFLLAPFLQELSMVPIFSYQRGINKISLNIKQKESFLKKIGYAALLAIIFSLIGNYVIQDYFEPARTLVIKPACDAFLGVLKLLCGPLIFFSICTGILSFSSGTSNNSDVGVKIIFTFLKKTASTSLFFIAFLCLFYPVSISFSVASGGMDFFTEMSKLIFGIIPSNLLNPFLSGNTIQIALLATILGFVFLAGGKKYNALTSIIVQMNALFQNLMDIVGRYSYLLIFLLILSQPINDSGLLSLSLLKIVIISSLGIILYLILWVCYTSYHIKKSVSFVIKAVSTPTIMALATASSAIAYHEMIRSCIEKFKLTKSVTDFGVSMGIVLCKNGESVAYIGIAFFTANLFNTEMTLLWLMLAFASIYIFAIASPPVAGGGLIVLPALFSQLNIPMEALSIGLFTFIIMDFSVTALKVCTIILYTVDVSYKNNLIVPELVAKS